MTSLSTLYCNFVQKALCNFNLIFKWLFRRQGFQVDTLVVRFYKHLSCQQVWQLLVRPLGVVSMHLLVHSAEDT